MTSVALIDSPTAIQAELPVEEAISTKKWVAVALAIMCFAGAHFFPPVVLLSVALLFYAGKENNKENSAPEVVAFVPRQRSASMDAAILDYQRQKLLDQRTRRRAVTL